MSPLPDRVITATADRRTAVLEVIRNATSTLALSLFRCNDEAIFAEIARATARGVVVDVLVTARAKGGRKKLERLFAALRRTGANISIYNDPVVKYHAKYIVADDGPAVVASLNLTRKCFTRTLDILVVTWDADVVAGLRQLMAADRDGRPLPEPLTRRLIVGPERARSCSPLCSMARRRASDHRREVVRSRSGALLDMKRDAGISSRSMGRRLGGLKSHGKPC